MASTKQPLSFTVPTALVLIDIQSAFTNPATIGHWGTTRSNPHFEANGESLLKAFRSARASHPDLIEIAHVFHSSTTPTSPLHPAHPAQASTPIPFAKPAPDGSEPVFWKNVNSAFVGTELEAYLRKKGIRQIFFAGLTTDHCVSTSVRMAANFGIVDRGGEKGRLVLVQDATATWDKGGFDAETVHKVSVVSLDGEFADAWETEGVVKALEGLRTN